MDICWFGCVPVGVNRRRVVDGWVVSHRVFNIPGALRLAKWLYL